MQPEGGRAGSAAEKHSPKSAVPIAHINILGGAGSGGGKLGIKLGHSVAVPIAAMASRQHSVPAGTGAGEPPAARQPPLLPTSTWPHASASELADEDVNGAMAWMEALGGPGSVLQPLPEGHDHSQEQPALPPPDRRTLAPHQLPQRVNRPLNARDAAQFSGRWQAQQRLHAAPRWGPVGGAAGAPAAAHGGLADVPQRPRSGRLRIKRT